MIGKIGNQQTRGYYGSLGYRSVAVANREGRSYIRSSGARHEQYDRIKLIAQSRDFIRNNPIYKGMIERAAGYITGSGFVLQSMASKKTAKKIETLWNDFWRRPEIKNILSGRGVEKMVARELLTVGDTAAIKTKSKKIQLIEAEQIAGKNQNGTGIETDKYGAPIKYFAGGYAQSGAVDKRTIKPFTPEQFMFLAIPERPSSIRGVPPCQSAFPMLHRINDVCDSEAIAWQMLARFAVSITRKQGAKFGHIGSRPDPNKTGTDTSGHMANRLTELDYALIFNGEEGEEVKGIERNIPGQSFSESLTMFLRLLGLPIGLPLEIVLLDWTKSNYSQSRAVLEQAYQTFVDHQNRIAEFFLTPIFEWKLAQWIDEGQISGRDIINHEWIKPSFPWLDKLKEVKAYGEQVEKCFVTHQTVCKSLNSERTDVVDARAVEIVDAIERVKAIEKATGEKVPWQIFAGLAVPAAVAAVAEDDEPIPTKKKDDKNA